MRELILSILPLMLMMYADPPPQVEPAQTATTATNMAVDTEVCSNCHEDQITGMQHTKHANVPGRCANCHTGDLARHAEEADPTLVTTPLELKPRDASNLCLNCHERGEQSHFRGGVHDRRNVTCANCHGVHNFKSVRAQLKTVRGADTCFSCHPAIRSMGMRTSHHPVREGKMDCGSCHNPHGSTTEKMIRAASVNEQCYTCHTEKRGPFLWEHQPVRENCTNCHNAHGSNHDKLLVAKQPYLCQRCHLNTRHPGTLYDFRNTAAGTNPSNRAVEHGCRNCHQNVHGTNHPSGPYFGR